MDMNIKNYDSHILKKQKQIKMQQEYLKLI